MELHYRRHIDQLIPRDQGSAIRGSKEDDDNLDHGRRVSHASTRLGQITFPQFVMNNQLGLTESGFRTRTPYEEIQGNRSVSWN